MNATVGTPWKASSEYNFIRISKAARAKNGVDAFGVFIPREAKISRILQLRALIQPTVARYKRHKLDLRRDMIIDQLRTWRDSIEGQKLPAWWSANPDTKEP